MIRPNLYDYLKLFAIVTMIIDHIGYFLYPDIMELRMIWRRAFPMFFFLIGRNWSSHIPHSLMFRACFIQWVLRWTSYLQWYDLRQLNILPVAILVKLFLWYVHHCEDVGTDNTPTEQSISDNNKAITVKNPILLFIFLILFTALSPLWKWIIEYGLMWFTMAIFGYIVKQKKIIWSKWVTLAALISLIGCIIINHQFPFNTIQWIIVICWWFVIWYIVYTRDLYSTWIYSDTINHQSKWINVIKKTVLWISNNAVWIYVIHFSLLLSIVIMRKS
jgi:hypothetical protein